MSQEQLMAYLDGELSAHEAAVAAAHLQHCRECQEFAADLQSVSRHLSAWQVNEPSPVLAERLQAALNTPRLKQKRNARFGFPIGHYRTFGFVACCVTLAIAATAILSRRSISPQRSSASPVYLPDYKPKSRAIPKQFISGELMAPSAAPAPPPAQTATPSGPLIIRTAQISLTTNDFPHIRESINRILNSRAGYIAQLEMKTPTGEARSLDASLRIPATQLDAALGDLKRLGHVDSESQSGEEVTQRVVDVQARLANLRTTEARLTEILRQRTGKLADVLAVEEQIDSVRGQIESMEAEQKSLAKQIDFAAVQLTVNEEYKKPLAFNNNSLLTRLRNAAIEGFQTLGNGVVGLLLFFLSYGPTLLIIAAVLFYPARQIWKRYSVS